MLWINFESLYLLTLKFWRNWFTAKPQLNDNGKLIERVIKSDNLEIGHQRVPFPSLAFMSTHYSEQRSITDNKENVINQTNSNVPYGFICFIIVFSIY